MVAIENADVPGAVDDWQWKGIGGFIINDFTFVLDAQNFWI